MAAFDPDNVCTTTQKFRNLKTTLAWMKTLCISRAPKKALRKQVFCSMEQVPKVTVKARKLDFHTLAKSGLLFYFPKEIT